MDTSQMSTEDEDRAIITWFGIPKLPIGEPGPRFDLRLSSRLILSASIELELDLEFVLKTNDDGDDCIVSRSAQTTITHAPPEHAADTNYLSTVGPTHITAIDVRLDSGEELTLRQKAETLLEIGQMYSAVYEKDRDRRDSNVAIACFQQGILMTSEDGPLRLSLLANISGGYLNRFRQLRQLDAVDAAITHGRRALSLAPPENINILVILLNLGVSHMYRSECLGTIDDVEAAISCQTKVLSMVDEQHSVRMRALNDLSLSFEALARRRGNFDDLNTSIEHMTKAVALAPDDNPYKSELLSCLCRLYMTRFEMWGKARSDINTAIRYQVLSLSMTPDGHPNKLGRLAQLSKSYGARFIYGGGNREDLDKSIEGHRHAVELTPDEHPSKPRYLGELGVSLMNRYELLGQVEDLESGIRLQSQAVSSLPDGDANKVLLLCNLANSMKWRFRRFDQLADLDEAIALYMQTVKLAAGPHPDVFIRILTLNGAGAAFMYRFDRLGEITDLDKAISQYTEAFIHMPQDCVLKLAALIGIGITYYREFELTQNIDNLDAIVVYLNLALSELPPGHLTEPMILDNLGMAHLEMYKRSKATSDIETAIRHQSRTLLLLWDDQFKKAPCLAHLSANYGWKYEFSKDMADLSRAIEFQICAVQNTPVDHPLQPIQLHELGLLYRSRYFALQGSLDLERSIYTFQKAASLPVGLPSARLKSACFCARLSMLYDPASSLSAYTHAMKLIPQVVWIGNSIQSRYSHILKKLDGINLEAANAAICCTDYESAFEWLEVGKSIVWGQILQLRAPLERITGMDSSLGKDLSETARDLEFVSSPNSISSTELLFGSLSLEQITQMHHRLSERWEQLIAKARLLPGMNSFLRPLQAFQLTSAAHSSAIVCIAVHELGCHALIVAQGTTEITHLSLSSFSVQKANSAHSELTDLLRSRGRSDRQVVYEAQDVQGTGDGFKRVLAMLWYDVAEPILNHLGFREPSTGSHHPRVTWCTTGSLNFLPLHAAGSHTRPGCTVFERVVSSYTPYLGALLDRPEKPTNFSGILAVGQSSAHGRLDLPGTIVELGQIRLHAGDLSVTTLEDSSATTSAVLEAIEKNSWVHFACHASQNLDEPMLSAFQLHDGPLDLAMIARKSHPNARLAFLSACQTATGDIDKPDEAVHLAAGMVIAGFRTVIGTMWSIDDADAPIIAQKFYASMFRNEKLSGMSAARALHAATDHLRKTIGVEEFMRWVPYIHLGI